MKRRSYALLVMASLALASPARAETWSIGPSLGFDVISAEGRTVAALAIPASSDLFTLGVRPGLRIGVTSASGRHQWFADTGVQVLSGSFRTTHVLSGTVNYAYAFMPESSPYVTVGIGASNFGYDGESQTAMLYGFGLGGRQRLAHGHGAIRVEARYDRATSDAFFPRDLNIIGVRLGFDLDLN